MTAIATPNLTEAEQAAITAATEHADRVIASLPPITGARVDVWLSGPEERTVVTAGVEREAPGSWTLTRIARFVPGPNALPAPPRGYYQIMCSGETRGYAFKALDGNLIP